MNQKKGIFTIFLLVLFTELVSQSAICSYSYRKRITFDPTKVAGASDLTNFPALINITSDNDLRTTANSGHVQNSNGYDIVFTAADGVTLLSFQLERYTATNGQLTAWVKIPTLSTTYNTCIYMYYGNSAITTDQSSTAVWNNYYAVWHFQNNSFTDNSGNSQTASNFSTTNQSPAVVNDGRANNGTQWMEMASFPNLTTDFSMSAWVYTSDNSRGGQRVFCDDEGVTGGGYALSIADGGTGNIRFFSRASNPVILDSPGGLIANNTWYYVTGVANIAASTKSIFINGSSVANGSFSNAWGTDNGKCSIAGEVATGETGNRLQGRIDEVRVAKSVLSADWISTEYNNQSSPSTFYTISAEPNVFTGASGTGWNTAGNWSSGSVPSASTDVILSPTSNQPNLNANVQMASVWVHPSTTLTIGNNRNLQILYDVTNCGEIIGNNNNSEIELNSTSQIQVQNLSGSGVYNLRDLTINNTFSASPSVVLSTSISVSSDLVLTSGVVSTTSTNILALGTSATSSPGSAVSYISGPMTKAGTAAFVFPVGKGGAWRRIAVSAPSSNSTFRAEYFNSAYTSTTPVTSPLTDISQIEYWQLDRLSGTGSSSVSLYWESASASGINNCPDLTVAHWNGSTWAEDAASTVSGSSCSGSGSGIVTTTAQVSSFSPFTFGSKSTSLNPLPVELIKFDVSCLEGIAQFYWTTASEYRNDYFSLEYSSGDEKWQEVKRFKGAGTTSARHDYEWTTDGFDKGYYRLVQVDADNTRKIFKSLYLDCESRITDHYILYPNPAITEFTLQFDLSRSMPGAEVIIFDLTGQVVFTQVVNLLAGRQIIRLSPNLKKGLYFVQVKTLDLQLPVYKLVIE